VPETLLQTKLYIPPLRPDLVPRPRLIEKLNQGLQQGKKLTLISAPAGFGKTTLVSEWVNQKAEGGGMKDESKETSHPSSFILYPSKVAWLSLDEGDTDLTRFLAYFVAALQTLALSGVEGVTENIGEGVLGRLQSAQPPPTESILTALLNEIATVPDSFVLVLDDYYAVDARPVDNALAFLLEHLPPQMHLVIATREDPHLPLARLRVRGQLTELRATDLRFTLIEASGFFNQVMGLNLSAEEIAALEIRTEGWIAGLQLAAISMEGRKDTTSFIKSFTGSHHFVLDYLVEEVLQRQPENVHSFLLQTSILDRLSGPLCDAVTGQEDGRGIVEALERGNLFVVPLDDRRQWYRYHHLFADVLHAHLMEEQLDRVPTLHRRASEWYEHNGMPADAIRHALVAEDFERAAALVELAWPVMNESAQSTIWLGWVKALPDKLIRTRPVLSVSYAWALLTDGELEAFEARLQDAERWLDTTADMRVRPGDLSVEMVVVDEEQFVTLPVAIANARAYHDQALGDVAGTVEYTQRALDLLPEGDHLRRGQATMLLGLAYWASGDLEAAHRTISDVISNMRIAGNILFAIGSTFVLAEIMMALGRLHEASSTYQHSLQLAAGLGEPVPPGTEDLHRGISELHRERGDLEAAAQQLLMSKKLGEKIDLPDWGHRLNVTHARIKQSQGDLGGALDLLDEAERQYIRTPLPYLRPIAALKTRIWVAQGRLAETLGWVREQGLSVDDDLSYLREFEHVTLARVLIAQYKSGRADGSIHKAIGLLERLLQAAEEGGRMGSVIEILVLQALARHALGDIPRALDSLERALTLAEPEGYIRIFVDEGPPMAELLIRVKDEGGRMREYIGQLLAAFGETKTTLPSSLRLRSGQALISQPLIEPLSERELEVLKLLGTELSGPEIATELMVSPNTMRTHTKNIYSKLVVHNRRAAVRRAEELNLL
jgi:LuxR family maltose regulon positive regulatory protein